MQSQPLPARKLSLLPSLQLTPTANGPFFPAHLGYVGGDGVEDVDEDEEDGDEQRHPAGDDGRRHQEGDPGDDDEHARREVVRDDVVGDLPP